MVHVNSIGVCFELFRVYAAADEAGNQITNRGRQKPNTHHLPYKTSGLSLVIEDSPTGLSDSSPKVCKQIADHEPKRGNLYQAARCDKLLAGNIIIKKPTPAIASPKANFSGARNVDIRFPKTSPQPCKNRSKDDDKEMN